MDDPQLTRGERNQNPGNIDYDDTAWEGLANPPSDGRFCIFVSPFYGLRAIAKILQTYQIEEGLHSVGAIIDRWAPASENNTQAYVADVCQRCSLTPDQPFAANDAAVQEALVRAIVIHENGRCIYTDTEIATAVQAVLAA
jgi:hypothetical protein